MIAMIVKVNYSNQRVEKVRDFFFQLELSKNKKKRNKYYYSFFGLLTLEEN